LDEIAWVLNLRGNDICYNPVFFSYLLIDFTEQKPRAKLFIDKIKISENVKEYLSKNNIEALDYDDIFDIISQFKNKKCLVNENACNVKLLSLF
jgi:Xaa-Pro aminopeptidase